MADNKKEETQETEHKNGLDVFKSMSTPKKVGVIAIFGCMFAVIIFIIFFSNDKKTPQNVPDSIKQERVQIQTPTQQEIKNVYTEKSEKEAISIPNISNSITNLKPPAPPVLEKPQVDAPPPPPPQIEKINIETKAEKPQLPIDVKNKGKTEENTGPQISSSSVMAFGGGGNKDGQFNQTNQTNAKTDDTKNTKKSEFLGFDGGTIDNVNLTETTATTVSATKIKNDLKYTIVQGKIIDAVLETAINTQMSSGVIRAIVTRDVYGEQGDLVLIPKGSRLVGSYGTTQTTSGSNSAAVLTRVNAGWQRIITPSGVDINLPDTQATDPLGRVGIQGFLDTNLSNNLTNAFLVSLLGPYLIAKITGISNDASNSSTTTDPNTGNQTTSVTSTTGSQILTQGMQDFGDVAKEQLDKVYPPGLIINYVDQGTRIDVIVQQDIIFPKSAISLSTTNLP